jgi:hypothetical protein
VGPDVRPDEQKYFPQVAADGSILTVLMHFQPPLIVLAGNYVNAAKGLLKMMTRTLSHLWGIFLAASS